MTSYPTMYLLKPTADGAQSFTKHTGKRTWQSGRAWLAEQLSGAAPAEASEFSASSPAERASAELRIRCRARAPAARTAGRSDGRTTGLGGDGFDGRKDGLTGSGELGFARDCRTDSHEADGQTDGCADTGSGRRTAPK